MLTQEEKKQFNEILEELGKNLDISETEHKIAVASYVSVGEWLSDEESSLAPYNPQILPQGSFLLGTVIKPTNGKDDIDIDLVCQLTGKNPTWTQAILKQKVKERLEAKATYKEMLGSEGRRCWTLKYRDESDSKKYHLDILPSIIAEDYLVISQNAFSNLYDNKFDNIAIRITDTEEQNYKTETNSDLWLKSNPFGYAKWFYKKATIVEQNNVINQSVSPAPKYQTKKLPLQRVVQILKRHRDMMFNGDDEKPISIIITTLAAKSYNKQTNIIDALNSVIDNIELHIDERYDQIRGKFYKFIGNPVNAEENFADKWRENINKEKKFYKWLKQVKFDLQTATEQKGIYRIQESLSKSFGKVAVTKTFTNIGNSTTTATQQGNTYFDTKAGIISGATNIIKPHTHYGSK